MHGKGCVRFSGVCFSCDIRAYGYDETVHWEDTMTKAPDDRGVAEGFRSCRRQAVRLPAACWLETSEVAVVNQGDCETLRPRGKNWAANFDFKSRGSLPERFQPSPLNDA